MHSLKATVRLRPGPGDNFEAAAFSLVVSEKITDPAYVLVLLPGFTGRGETLLEDRRWSRFAEDTDAAIVAGTFRAMDPKKPGFVHYAAAQQGGGAAVEAASEQLGVKASVPSLKDLPLLLYGYSAGGQFAYGFSCHNPYRMAGFAAVKGGWYFPAPIEGTYDVPGLLISGRRDLARRRTGIRSLFVLHRAMCGAPWCWLEDEGGHEEGKCLSVVIPYFRDLLEQQLGGGVRGTGRSKLSGVVIDLEGQRILREDAVFGLGDRDPEQGWLPSRAAFEAWSRLDVGKRKLSE